MDTRICHECQQEQPITQFRRGKAKPNGRRYHSHQCNTCRGKARREATALQRAARPPKPQEKTCQACGEIKPLSAFDHHKTCRPCWNLIRTAHAALLRATDPAFQAWEAEKKRLWKLWGKEHPAQRNAAQKRWNAANPDKIRASYTKYNRQHPRGPRTPREAVQQQAYHESHMRDPEYREQRNAANRAWELANPLKVQERNARRRARQRNAPVVEKIDRATIYERDRWICQLCFKPVTPEDASIDHVIPVIDGGNHTYQNLVTAHLFCNKSKGARRVPQQQRLFG